MANIVAGALPGVPWQRFRNPRIRRKFWCQGTISGKKKIVNRSGLRAIVRGSLSGRLSLR